MATVNASEATSTASTTAPQTINVGTRKSLLALNQTEIVTGLLKRAWPHYEYKIQALSTMGDKNQVTPLHDFGAKSLWTHELEALLLNGDVDMIVHSLKDIPTQIPAGCSLGAILPRGDPRDALVLHPSLPPSTTLSMLPEDSIIGTSSVRRSAQLKRLYPHLRFQSVRGNLGTRLRKLDESILEDGGSGRVNGTKQGDSHTVSEDDLGAARPAYSALILAAAGLIRVDEGKRITRFMSTRDAEDSRPYSSSSSNRPLQTTSNSSRGILHAVGQGALGIETRTDDQRIADLLAPIICKRTTMACLAERSLLRTLEGGCSVPIGVETEWGGEVGDGVERGSKRKRGDAGAGASAELLGMGPDIAVTAASPRQSADKCGTHDPEESLTLRAIVVSLDGTRAVEASATERITDRTGAEDFGIEVARRLVEKGAEKILKEITLNRGIIEAQGDA